MNRFRLRLSIWFSCVVIIASILSFLTTNILPYHHASSDFKNTQLQIATTMLELNNLEKLPTDKISKLVSSSMFPISKVTNIYSLNLSDNDMEILQKGNLLYKSSLVYGTQYVKLGNDIFSITVNPYSNVFFTSARETAATLLFAIILCILFVSLSYKRMLWGFNMTIEAIKEVAKGNFEIKLPMTKYLSERQARHVAKHAKHSHNSQNSLISNFNKMTSELNKMETLRNDFISNVSHEFKTPIASIQGFATLLSQSNLSEEQKEYAEIIASESARLAKLSDNILKLTKLQNQEIVTEKQWYALDEQLRQCLLILEKKWNDKKINLEINLDEIKYLGNKELLEQVWINLIDNAIKYSNMSGTIVLSCKKEHHKAIVSIRDNGIGMNEETIERVFEKFYQGDPAHHSEGNGLGLSLVKRIIDLCNGTIEIESVENLGSTFIVTLPIETNKLNM